MAIAKTEPISDFAWYERRAVELLAGDGYKNNAGNPTAFWPIGYPLFLAAIKAVGGTSPIAVGIVQATLSTVSIWLTYEIARRVVSPGWAVLASAVVAFNPSQIVYASVEGTETLFTLLFLSSLLLLLRVTPEKLDRRQLLLIGVIVGYAMLVRAVALLLPVLFIAFLWWQLPKGKRLIPVAAFAIGVAVIVSPWLIRNVIVMGTPSLSTSGGVNFRIGNGPGATGEWRNFAPGDPILDYEGEAERDRAGYTLTFKDIAADPARVIKLIPRKMSLLWWSDESGFYWSLTSRSENTPRIPQARLIQLNDTFWKWFLVFAVAGVVAAYARNRTTRTSMLLMAILGYWVVMHAALIANDRFHMPVIPIMGIFAVFGLMTASEYVSRAFAGAEAATDPGLRGETPQGAANARSKRARKRGHS